MKPIVALAAACALGIGGIQLAFAQAADVPSTPLDSQHPAFDQVDSDGDRQISREEAEAAGLEIDWSEADSDGSGALTQEEYDSVISVEPSPSAPSDSDGNMDGSGDGANPGIVDDGLGTEPRGMD